MVFDLDGTLVDSWVVHRYCLRQAAAAAGLEEPSAARIATAQRATDVATLRALVGEERLGTALPVYGRALREALLRRPVPAMPGARAAVERLREGAWVLGVCTGRSREDAQALLDASGLAVGLTVAREDAPRPKPAPDGLARALRLLGLTADEALYVGDSTVDAQQGRAAGIRTLLVGPHGAVLSGVPAPDSATWIAGLRDLPTLLRKELR
ncbi:HAD family hydrolase [Streptomyces sp. NPDC056987]|uniref:HAD family hydrolase n=1 Tax=Streptomyces sp. NPDC056987 TaxID=3345988 RepID=UPI0036459F67